MYRRYIHQAHYVTSEAPLTMHWLERSSRPGLCRSSRRQRVSYTVVDIYTVVALLKLSPSNRLLECVSFAQHHRLVGRRGGCHRRNRSYGLLITKLSAQTQGLIFWESLTSRRCSVLGIYNATWGIWGGPYCPTLVHSEPVVHSCLEVYYYILMRCTHGGSPGAS